MIQVSDRMSSAAVVQDIVSALQDEDLRDVSLIGDDGVEVRACRFVLAARSKVWKRMLYGSFREASSTGVELMYSGKTLQAMVDFCIHNKISHNFLSFKEDTETVRELVKLAKAADYFAMPVLFHQAESLVQKLVSKKPCLACPVFDEAEETSAVHEFALRMIRCRPYVALMPSPNDTTGSGIETLKADRIIGLMKDTDIEVGELFLFEMLKIWVEHVGEQHKEEALNIARQCEKFFKLHYIEPQELLSTVQQSGLLSPNLIVEAIMRQALRASENRVWTINCRGPAGDLDRVLVEGGGNQEVNGVYHRIRGLSKGEVYSKHEVSCGQLLVYTLSCSQKDDTIESRIFSSKLLTHGAIRMLQRLPSISPSFQPLLQIIRLESPNLNAVDRSLAKLFQVQLSDGDCYMAGTLGINLNPLVEKNEIVENSLIKVLAYDQYQLDGKLRIHIKEVSLVGTHPGHTFGNPVDPTTVETLEDMGIREGNWKDIQADSLQKLYSCNYPVSNQAKDTRIPRTGWSVEEHGTGPAPKCTFIPAIGKQFEDCSSCQ